MARGKEKEKEKEKRKKSRVPCVFVVRLLVVAGGVPEEAVPVEEFAMHPLVWLWYAIVVINPL